MPSTGSWGFFSLLLLLIAGFGLELGGSEALHSAWTGIFGTHSVSLLCTGGERTVYDGHDVVRREPNPGLTMTVDWTKKIVQVSAGEFGTVEAPMKEPITADHFVFDHPDAHGEVNRLTGIAHNLMLGVEDHEHETLDGAECRRRMQKF